MFYVTLLSGACFDGKCLDLYHLKIYRHISKNSTILRQIDHHLDELEAYEVDPL